MNKSKKITVPGAAATAEGQSNVTNTVSIAEESVIRNKKVKGPSRMISDAIISSGRFLKLSDKAKTLYMYLIVRTDDEGIVEAYPVMVLLGATKEVLKELAEKDFVVRLNDDDVVYVKDFFEQNTLRADRVKASRYHDLLADVCPQNAADCQPNIIQSNLIECKVKEENSSQSNSIREDETETDVNTLPVHNPKEEYVIPYIMDRHGKKHGLNEDDVRCLVELADALEGISRETDDDPEGLGYEWMKNYFSIKFRMLEHELSRSEINNKFAYMKKMVENDLRSEGKLPEEYYNTRAAG